MLPTTSFNVLDSPAKKIKDLIDAAKVEYDPNFSLKNYVRSAQSILNLVSHPLTTSLFPQGANTLLCSLCTLLAPLTSIQCL